MKKIRQKYSPTSYIDEETPYMSVVSEALSLPNPIHQTSFLFNHSGGGSESITGNNNNNNTSTTNNIRSKQSKHNQSNNSGEIIAIKSEGSSDQYLQDLASMPQSIRSQSLNPNKNIDILLKSLSAALPEGSPIKLNQRIAFKHFNTDSFLRVQMRTLPQETNPNHDSQWSLQPHDIETNEKSIACETQQIHSSNLLIIHNFSLDADLTVARRRVEGIDITCEKRRRGSQLLSQTEINSQSQSQYTAGIGSGSGIGIEESNVQWKSDLRNWLWRVVAHNSDGILRANSIVSLVNNASGKLIVPTRKSNLKMIDVTFSQKRFSPVDREINDLWIICAQEAFFD